MVKIYIEWSELYFFLLLFKLIQIELNSCTILNSVHKPDSENQNLECNNLQNIKNKMKKRNFSQSRIADKEQSQTLQLKVSRQKSLNIQKETPTRYNLFII